MFNKKKNLLYTLSAQNTNTDNCKITQYLFGKMLLTFFAIQINSIKLCSCHQQIKIKIIYIIVVEFILISDTTIILAQNNIRSDIFFLVIIISFSLYYTVFENIKSYNNNTFKMIHICTIDDKLTCNFNVTLFSSYN